MRNRPPWLMPVLIAMGALLIVIVVNLVAIAGKPSDESQIRQAIETMRQASLKNQAGGVQEHLSRDIELPAGINQSQITQFIRKANIGKLEIKINAIEISGLSAVARCDVSTTLSYLGFTLDQTFTDMQIEFHKETSRRLLILPDSSWRVTKFSNVKIEQWPM